ncbi:MAG: terminase small subunit [Shimia sp.]|nr:terminase small subunit [Shimia sp.]
MSTLKKITPAPVPAELTEEEAAHLAAVDRLTRKQKAFIDEYVIDYNATRAAERAGYENKSDKALGVQGWKLLRHPVVGPEIRRRGRATADELGITSEYVLVRLRDMVERWANGDDDSPFAARAALELIGKLRGDMIERVQAEVKVLSVQLNDVNMEDLR